VIDSTPEERKIKRAARIWGRVVPLGAEPEGDLLAHSTVAERLALVEEITRETWALAKKPMPRFNRHDAPIRIISLSQDRNEPR
jgi:hypothetical protein